MPVPTHPGTTQDGWEIENSETVYQNPYLAVFVEYVRSPGRPTAIPWTIVRRKKAVVIAPKTLDGKYLLIRQERIPIARAIWEFPAGQVDSKAPTLELAHATAQRELAEETGHCLSEGKCLELLGEFFSSPGFTDEAAWQFLADGVEPDPAGTAHDEHETIVECRAFTWAELTEMVSHGEIRDANTLSLYARLAASGKG